MRVRFFGIIAFAAAVALAPSMASADGPFGVSMASDIDSIGEYEEVGNFLYEFSTLPKKHAYFESFVIKSHPSTGVCQVIAVGRSINTNRFGDSVKEMFDKLRGQVDNVYGRSDLIDGPIVTNANLGQLDWMTELMTRRRGLQSAWDKISGADLRDNIRQILLTASAEGSEQGYVNLQYRFSNFDECDEAIRTEQEKAL
jgi:hypothetical protein